MTSPWFYDTTVLVGDPPALENGMYPGYQAYMLSNVPDYEYYLFLFQYVFAATIATIVSGAVAERIQFKAYMVYAFVLTGVIYPIAAHWTWSGDGWLNKIGVFDYAGGNAVHALSGVTAWMAAFLLGPRIGKFVDGKPVELATHNVSFMVLGTFILWLSFIPFIAGSPCALNFQVGRMAVMTTLNGCFGGCFALFYEVVVNHKVSVDGACIGVLAGMVGICTSCGVCPLWTTCFINTPISCLSYYFGQWFNTKLKADFVGLFYGGNGQQLGIQIFALLAITIYGLGAAGILFGSMKLCKILRVTEEQEIAGMDMIKHGGPAYTMEDVAPGGAKSSGKQTVLEA